MLLLLLIGLAFCPRQARLAMFVCVSITRLDLTQSLFILVRRRSGKRQGSGPAGRILVDRLRYVNLVQYEPDDTAADLGLSRYIT